MSDTSRDLTKGPVWRALAAMSAPMMLGIVAVISVGVADAYFLGQLGGAPLAAIGFIYPVTAAVTSLSIGLSAGANATVSQAIGRGDSDDASARIGLHAVALGVALSLFVGLAIYLGFPALFGLLGAGDRVMTEIAPFMPWWCLSFPFLVLMMLINALFRAHGDAAVAAIVMVGSAVVNIGLDPVLIYGWGPIPALGTEGAAMATFVARLVAAGAVFIYAIRQGLLRLTDTPAKDLGWSLTELGKVGGPAAFSNAINPAGMAAVTAAVATLGETAVGGFGAATRVQSMVMVPMLALSAGIGPVVGQNWGADKPDRAARTVQAAFAFCLGYGVLIGLALSLFARPIASALASDAEAAGYAAIYLRVVGWSLFGYGILVTANAAMNARSRAGWSMSLSLSRIFLVYLPGAWAGVSLFGFAGITGAAVLANVLVSGAAVFAVHRTGLFLPAKLKQTFA